MGVGDVLRKDDVGSLLRPEAVLLVVVRNVPADVDVMRGRLHATPAGIDLDTVPAVAPEFVVHDPDRVHALADVDAVAVLIEGGLDVSVVVNPVVIDNDVGGGAAEPSFNRQPPGAPVAADLAVPDGSMVDRRAEGEGTRCHAITVLEAKVLDDDVASADFPRPDDLRGTGGVGPDEYRLRSGPCGPEMGTSRVLGIVTAADLDYRSRR